MPPNHRIDLVRLGPVAGIDTGTRGVEYFDAFVSHRASYIGGVRGRGHVLAAPVARATGTPTPWPTPSLGGLGSSLIHPLLDSGQR